jgi:hypothetical protein
MYVKMNIEYVGFSSLGFEGKNVGVTSNTPRIFFSKVFPCLLVIISNYPLSYILGENILFS